MRHVLFEIPGLGWDIPGYGLALMIGFLLSIWWAARRALRSQADPDVVLNCGFIALIGGVVGSRLMYVWHYWEQFAERPNLIAALIDVRRGGLEVYGGVIAVALGVFMYLRWKKHSIRWYLDILAPSAALGMGIGRIGCFLNGCCFGGVCDLPWAVQFPYGSSPSHQQWVDRKADAGVPQELIFFQPLGTYPDGAAAHPISREILNPAVTAEDVAAAQRAEDELRAELASLRLKLKDVADPQQQQTIGARIRELERRKPYVLAEYVDIRTQMQKYGLTFDELRTIARQYRSLPVHPTQLYSVVTLVILAFLLDALYWRRTRDGQVICLFLFVEPLTRWMIEVIRADNPVDTLGTFTVSQFIAVMLSLIGLVTLILLKRASPRSPRAVPWIPPEEEKTTAQKGAPAGG